MRCCGWLVVGESVCEIVCESSCVNLLGLGKNDIFEVSPILFHRASHNFKPNKSSYRGINTKLELLAVGRKTGGRFENRANLHTWEAVI